jgi:hypothetical protein
MKLFFAGSESFIELVKEKKANMLMSYYHIKKDMKANPKIKVTYNIEADLFIDSGAFSAFSLGSKIDIDVYIEFCRNTDANYYAVLDVIGNPEGTLTNQLYMESKGVSPVPCFHYGEDFKYLDYYCKNYEFVAIGGLVPINKSAKERWLDMVFSKYPNHKFHGFGLTSAELVTRYPWFSVDSSSWLSGGKTGALFDLDLGVKHYSEINHTWKEKIKKVGLCPNKINTEYMERLRFNIIGYLEMQNRHEGKPFKARQAQLNIFDGEITVPAMPVVDYKDFLKKNYGEIKHPAQVAILQHEFGLTLEDATEAIK